MTASIENVSSNVAQHRIVDRKRAIEACAQRLFDMMMGDSDFAYEVARYGCPGFESMDDQDLLDELENSCLLESAIEDGFVARID
jgi:hypothetical protein